MITDAEIKAKGFQVLTRHLGDVEAERFVALIQREPFDYTKMAARHGRRIEFGGNKP